MPGNLPKSELVSAKMTRFERRWSDLPTKFDNVLSDMSQKNGKCQYIEQEDRRVVLKEFRKVLQDILKPSHDDEFLIRWLKARDFDIAKAERMVRDSFKFRKKINADAILTSAYELPELYQKYPLTGCLGFDKDNSVVRIFMAGICDYKGYVYSFRIVELMKLLVHFLEHDLKMLHEKKKTIGKLDEKTTFVLDFTGFNLKQFYDKTVINAGIQLITMYQDNYPETLKAAYLINVPSYFSWIFNLFKPFLNAVTLSKLKIYKGDEWKEEFFKIIDKKQVPGFMGGELTDPDGNPKCNYMINWDSKIPSSYYLNEDRQRGGEDDPSMKAVTVAQRSCFEVPVEVQLPGSILKWVFRTKDYNIRFGLFYRHKKNQLEELMPLESVDCQVLPEENDFVCERAGTYVLQFDNSYSWLTAKALWYKVEVEMHENNESNNN